jgi:hypothetical protein
LPGIYTNTTSAKASYSDARTSIFRPVKFMKRRYWVKLPDSSEYPRPDQKAMRFHMARERERKRGGECYCMNQAERDDELEAARQEDKEVGASFI